MKIPKSLMNELTKLVVEHRDEFDEHEPPKCNILNYIFDEDYVYLVRLSIKRIRKEIFELENTNNT